MYFTFWGTRGSVPTPGPATVRYGGNTSCVEVGAAGDVFIFDAGTGIRLLGLDLAARKDRPDTVHLFISHTHWDHIQGFPFFLPAFQKGFTIKIYGCQGTGNRIEKVLAKQMEDDYFPLSFLELNASMEFYDIEESPLRIGDAEIHHTFLNHPGLSLGFSVTAEGKKVVYAPDVEPFRDNVLSDDTDVNLNIRDYVADLDKKVVDLARDADCLLIDGTYTEEEYLSKPGWGHSSYVDSVRVAAEAGVRHLYLVHHDPAHGDDFIDQMVEKARAHAEKLNQTFTCEAGREGETVQV